MVSCVHPGSEFFLSQIPDPNFFHPGSASKNLSILTQKIVSKLSEIWPGLFIPDPDFLPIPDPGSRGQKGTGSGTATLAVCVCVQGLGGSFSVLEASATNTSLLRSQYSVTTTLNLSSSASFSAAKVSLDNSLLLFKQCSEWCLFMLEFWSRLG